jgi:hypothetical protein
MYKQPGKRGTVEFDSCFKICSEREIAPYRGEHHILFSERGV